MEVLRGVFLAKGEVSNIYIVRVAGGYVSVDAGTPNDYDRVLAYLRSAGIEPSDIKVIVVTHSHWDHAGGLRKLKDLTGAEVAAHKEEVPYLRGSAEPSRRRFEPVDVDIVLGDGDDVFGLKVIHTPGHTPGSICLLDTNRRAIFVGDLVYEEQGRLYEMHHHYSKDPQMNRASIARLVSYDFDNIMPSHGNPIVGKGKEVLKQLISELRI
jgi:glyoxylase-like metal-dependent hydrolase (beta-lactamase superfamily II)